MPAEAGIAAVVLAAGASRRFGKANKLLAPFDGTALVARVVQTLAAAGIEDIVAVTGCDAEAIAAALTGHRVRCVHNARWEAGMGGSIAVGVAALAADVRGALLVPGDMPLLAAETVGALAGRFAAARGERIVFAADAAGAQRNPVIWPRRFFAELRALPPAAGGKELLRRHADKAIGVPVADALLADVDTVEDLAAVVRGSAES